MHWLYITPFDRLFAALVMIKYKAIFVAILLANYQNSCFICLSSALLSQSINICTRHVYRCLSKASVRHSRFWSRFIPIRARRQNRGSLGFKSSIIGVSHDAPKVSARYIYGPTTLHGCSAMIHHGRATNAHDASKIRYGASMVQAGSVTTFSSCCILDESEWIGMSVISRFIPNAHEWPRLHLPHLKYEPEAATVELRFRPSPKSTTIQPECFKRFKTALACRAGSRITKILLELLQYYYDSRACP